MNYLDPVNNGTGTMAQGQETDSKVKYLKVKHAMILNFIYLLRFEVLNAKQR